MAKSTKKARRVLLGARVPEELHERLKAYAERRDLSLQDLVEQLLSDGLEGEDAARQRLREELRRALRGLI